MALLHNSLNLSALGNQNKLSFSSSKGAFRGSLGRRNHSRALVIKSEQQGQGFDGNKNVGIWLGRVGMLGFAGTLGVEIVTGKGVLENLGLTSPAPTPALVITAAIGLYTAFQVFTSVSDSFMRFDVLHSISL